MSTVIHLGLPKSGSTTLQRHFFPALPGCVALGPLPYGSPFRVLAQNLEQADDDEYLEETWRAFLSDARGSAETLILSREGLSRPTHRARIADRLHALAPDARIVICVREQGRMIRSFYGQHLRDGGVQSLAGWLDGFDRGWLRYDDLVSTYQERFGASRVYVTAFEHFTRDPQAYFDGLARFVRPGTASPVDASATPVENPGLSAMGRLVYRSTNRWFRRSRFNQDPVLRAPALVNASAVLARRLDDSPLRRWVRELSRTEQAAIERHRPWYRDANDRLVELTQLPLTELGYVTSANGRRNSDGPPPAQSRR